MPYVILIILAGLLGAYGWWRGGMRVGLSLAPLILASLLLWIFGGLMYRVDLFTIWGYAWPAIFLIVSGLAGGYALQFFLHKKLPKRPVRTDRTVGAGIGVLIAFVMVWLGAVYVAVKAASQGGTAPASRSAARLLNNGVVRWIPGIGAGSSALMDLVDFATVDDNVRRKVIEDLKLDELSDLPEMQKLLNDESTKNDVELASQGNLAALWRLQASPLVADLIHSRKMQEVLARISMDDIAQAVRDAKAAQAGP